MFIVDNDACRACGRRSFAAFCSPSCRQRGERHCSQCDAVLQRRVGERAADFRSRRTCGPECLRHAFRQRAIERWGNPTVRARIVRGLKLRIYDAEQIARMRERGHRTGHLLTKRRFTDAEVRVIRADQRSIYVIAEEFKVNASTISRIRKRKTYAHLTD